MRGERRGCIIRSKQKTNRKERVAELTRQYDIPQTTVKAAWKRVKKNKGSAGVDGQTIKEFEEDLEKNLYKIWNRMTSGSYFPPPVRTVSIPKSSGGERMLGIPTVSDRIAQQVAKTYLEPEVEKIFHEDSYAYRPGRSQEDALAKARQRCWKYNWCLEIDIKGFFDNIDHDMMLELVQLHTTEKWVILYCERWLKAGALKTDGTVEVGSTGAPQGAVLSPVLSNIFLHHAFDMWMKEENSDAPFERFADDLLLHCITKKHAEGLKERIIQRLKEWKLEINESKTRIVYCKDDVRPGDSDHTSFDFLGYTFRGRLAKNQKTNTLFIGFNPAISRQSLLKIYEETRTWQLLKCVQESLDWVAEKINPAVRGWMNYYGKFYRSELATLTWFLDGMLIRWALRKYKHLRKSWKRGSTWLAGIRSRTPHLFAHWPRRLAE